MVYDDVMLFVMSGTGNTYRLGCWMKEIVEQRGGRADVVMIEDADPDARISHSASSLIGLLFPAHGFMPPWSMIKFLFKMPRRRGVPALCAATRGCFKIGPVYVPGAAGIATFLAAVILMLKGFRVKALFSVDMPSNFINFHWGLHPKNVESITARARRRIDRLMPRILGGGRVWWTLNNLWESCWGLLILWFVPLFPILYLLIGRFFMGKLMFSNNRCVGCGLCARSCPNHGVLMKHGGKKDRPYWTFHCETCMRCMGYCPKGAVEAGHSWAVLAFFITSIPVMTYLLIWLRGMFPSIPVIDDYWTKSLLDILFIYPALIISYRIFWSLIRIPAINAIFTYSTLTHYYRRYHQPDTKVIHMTKGEKKRKKQGPDD